MKQVIQNVRSGSLTVADVPEPVVRPGGVLVRNHASLISAGTEKMIVDFAGKSMLGKARERPDLVRQVLDKVNKEGLSATVQTVLSRLDQPLPLGYSCAGVIEEVGRGAEEFSVGQRVACAGMGYASHADVVYVPKNLCVPIPHDVSTEDAAYVTVGAIALQGVRIAQVQLGETVAVIGLGLLGQLTVQILRAAGCRVFGIDVDAARAAFAIEMGAHAAEPRSGNVEEAASRFTQGVGMDAVIVTAATDSNDPIELAGLLCRDRGRVSMVGAVNMEVPRKVYYEKELDLRLSRSYGPGRYDSEYEEKGHDYPIGYVRWTERRNMQEFLRLVGARQVTPARMTTHRFPIAEATLAYDLITGKTPGPFSGVMLEYATVSGERAARRVNVANRPAAGGRVGIGFVGAGNFARAVLLPRFKKATNADLVGIATTTGVTARAAADTFGFRYCTTEAEQVIGDAGVGAVVIATRHSSHARYAAAALRAGKAVFVEKPLALNETDLAGVIDAQRDSGALLAVGFNRRFSPHAHELKRAFPAGTPLAVTYRINAGPIPANSWIHDPESGGGRIIGEVCHFIDLVQFLTGEPTTEVFAYSLGGAEGALHDTVAIVLRLGASVATIAYYAAGDKSFAKERIEVIGGGKVAVLDDFRELTISSGGKRRRTRTRAQAKGYDEEIAAFVAAIQAGSAPSISMESLVATTRATFAIEESLRTGQPVPVEPL